MCGISGAYSPHMSAKDVEVFKKLLIINQLRGEDSTGVLRVNTGKQIQMMRGLGDSSQFLRTDAAKQFVNIETNPMLLLGHCRKATVGAINKKNIHPFSFQHVIGVMNGTFRGTFDNSDKFSTDTEAIYFNINKSIDETGDFVTGLQNSMVYSPEYALAFVDRKNSTLNFIKNTKRPLHFTYVNNRKTLVWSSDSEHLEFIVEELMKITPSGWNTSDKDAVWTLGEHDLFQIKLGEPATSGTLVHKDIAPKAFTGYTYTSTGPYEMTGYEEYMDDDYGQPSANGTSSKILIKCEDGQYRSREAQRKRLEEIFRKDQSKNSSGTSSRVPNSGFNATKKDNSSATGGVVINYGKGANKKSNRPDGQDLSTLSWLQDVIDADEKEAREREAEDRFKQTALGKTTNLETNKPQSFHELAFRLAEGCMCCGVVIEPKNAIEVARIRWWNREAWACGTCYDNPETDWVKDSIDGQNALVITSSHRVLN